MSCPVLKFLHENEYFGRWDIPNFKKGGFSGWLFAYTGRGIVLNVPAPGSAAIRTALTYPVIG
jgi:hypothetical protein